jgi:hypothetical protein
VAIEKVVFFKNRLESRIEKAGASDTVRRVVTSGKASIVRALTVGKFSPPACPLCKQVERAGGEMAGGVTPRRARF